MINLLPADTKRSISYARRNTQLLRACLAVLAIIGCIIVLFGAGQWYLASSTAKYEDQVAQLKTSLQEQDIEGTKQRIQDLSGSVKLALQVLSQEILFSKLLRQAGSVMPDGSSLNSLEISNGVKGIDITAGVDNYQVGTQVQINLSNPNNKLFDKVDLVSVSCSGSAPAGYPCTAKLRALFGDNSPYLFINSKAGN